MLTVTIQIIGCESGSIYHSLYLIHLRISIYAEIE